MSLHPDEQHSTDRLLQLAGLPEGARILDLGAGKGETVCYLTDLGFSACGIERAAPVRSGEPGSRKNPVHVRRIAGGSQKGLKSSAISGPALLQIPAGRVIRGDMTALPFAGGTFDAVISECSLAVCGDAFAALQEARRVLRPGGMLLTGDVYYKKQAGAPCLSLPCPASQDGWRRTAAGFDLLKWEDISDRWLQFLIHCMWTGQNLGDCGFYRDASQSGTGYFLAVWRRREEQ